MRRYIRFVFGAALGGIIGSTLAILLAPSSGEALRNKISDYFVQTRNEIKEAAVQRRSELEMELETLRAPKKNR